MKRMDFSLAIVTMKTWSVLESVQMETGSSHSSIHFTGSATETFNSVQLVQIAILIKFVKGWMAVGVRAKHSGYITVHVRESYIKAAVLEFMIEGLSLILCNYLLLATSKS